MLHGKEKQTDKMQNKSDKVSTNMKGYLSFNTIKKP